MNARIISRPVLAAMGLSIAGLLATTVLFDAPRADAYSPNLVVSWSEWDQGTNFLLDAQTTADVNRDEDYADPVCGAGIDAAINAQLPMPDEAREACVQAVLACDHDAVRVRGNELTGVRFYTGQNSAYPLGGYRCLVR